MVHRWFKTTTGAGAEVFAAGTRYLLSLGVFFKRPQMSPEKQLQLFSTNQRYFQLIIQPVNTVYATKCETFDLRGIPISASLNMIEHNSFFALCSKQTFDTNISLYFHSLALQSTLWYLKINCCSLYFHALFNCRNGSAQRLKLHWALFLGG